MAHPFPPGSALQFPLTSLPSPVYHHSHHRRELEKGVDSPIQLRTNPQPYTQTVGRADAGGIAYDTNFIFIEPTDEALKICIIIRFIQKLHI